MFSGVCIKRQTKGLNLPVLSPLVVKEEEQERGPEVVLYLRKVSVKKFRLVFVVVELLKILDKHLTRR